MGIVHRTVYDSTEQATSHPIALPAAVAGNRLVLAAAGPANLSLSAGDLDAGWVVRASSPINFGELILAELPSAAGGEDEVTVNLNGPRAINAVVYERDDLDALLDADAIRTAGATSPYASAEVATETGLALALFVFARFGANAEGESATGWTAGVEEDYDATVNPDSNDSTWLATGWGAFEAAGAKSTQITGATASSLDGVYSAAGAWSALEPPPPTPGGGSLGGRRRLGRPFAFTGRWGS